MGFASTGISALQYNFPIVKISKREKLINGTVVTVFHDMLPPFIEMFGSISFVKRLPPVLVHFHTRNSFSFHACHFLLYINLTKQFNLADNSG